MALRGFVTNRRLRAALDALPTNCLLANHRLELVYMNKRSEQTLSTLEPVIREEFGLGFSELVGGSIHRFHRDPARVERILADPASFPHRAVLPFGDVKLQAEFDVVLGRGDRIVGYVVAWSDATRTIDLLGHVGGVTTTLEGLSAELADTSTEASSQAERIASGAEQMSTTVAEISSSAAEAADAGQLAYSAAGDAIDVVGSLETSSRAIDDIVDLITEITDKTRLLALNATIEAARAGEAGRGFSVVADGVKDLADRTRDATEQIAERIVSMRGDVASSGDAIRRVHEQLEQIHEFQSTIAAAIEEQTATSSEMADGISRVADGNRRTVGASGTLSELVNRTGGQIAALRRDLGY